MGDMSELFSGDFLDAFDDFEGFREEEGDGYTRRFRAPKYKTCDRCGKAGLKWGRHGDGFRLFENEILHVCHKRLGTCTGEPILKLKPEDAKRIGDKIIEAQSKKGIEMSGRCFSRDTDYNGFIMGDVYANVNINGQVMFSKNASKELKLPMGDDEGEYRYVFLTYKNKALVAKMHRHPGETKIRIIQGRNGASFHIPKKFRNARNLKFDKSRRCPIEIEFTEEGKPICHVDLIYRCAGDPNVRQVPPPRILVNKKAKTLIEKPAPVLLEPAPVSTELVAVDNKGMVPVPKFDMTFFTNINTLLETVQEMYIKSQDILEKLNQLPNKENT